MKIQTLPRTLVMTIRAGFGPFLLAGLLAGCFADTVRTYNPLQASKEIEVVRVDVPHDVFFAAGKHRISTAEKARLGAFVTSMAAGRSDSIVVDPGVTPGAAANPRADAVVSYIRQTVPGHEVIVRHLGAPIPGESIRVVVGRFMAIAPDCPNYSSLSDRNPNNTASSNFGCATITNLALMVADPADLIHGRGLSPSDAAIDAGAVFIYRGGDSDGGDGGDDSGGSDSGDGGGDR